MSEATDEQFQGETTADGQYQREATADEQFQGDSADKHFQGEVTAGEHYQGEVTADELSQSYITDEQIIEVFDAYDVDGSDKLNMTELKNALHLLGLDITDDELSSTFSIDDNPDILTLEQFTTYVRDRILTERIDFRQRCEDCLREFVDGDSGKLTRDQLKIILTQKGSSPVTDEEAEALMDEFDVNGDGIFEPWELAGKMYS